MTSTSLPQPAATARPAAVPDDVVGRRVRSLRKPWQWVLTAVVIVLVLNFGQTLFTNRSWEWPKVGKWVLHPAILQGVLVTIEATAIAAVASFVLGVLVALARQSNNVVLRSLAWFYIWVFRSVPLLVVLLFLYNLPNLYPAIGIGIPFGPQLQVPTTSILGDLALGALGLTLSETAYAAEVVRSGLLAVDNGQHEAAKALGIPRYRQLTRIVLPQALRSIVPSYVNQIIGLIKSSSLLFYVSLLDLFGVAQNLASTYPTDIIPLLVVATIWYLVLTSLISIVQFYVERYYNRGLKGAR
ncbi:amino acid ABC transporter permease [uncultured Amnibacterium sp.]|uniref:amino acid ABC transporter permease n=1 Tax=uncultured Amnibacterium sp. TaxID=1631851 RepID=UPI0035CC20DF